MSGVVVGFDGSSSSTSMTLVLQDVNVETMRLYYGDWVAPEFKQEPHRWAWQHKVAILSPRGWEVDSKDFHESITEAEFLKRLLNSTFLAEQGCVL